jgi:hypothetical protein
MSKMSGFSWPQNTIIKRNEPSEPPPNYRLLKIGIGVASAVTGLAIIYTLFFFGLKWRKARAARQKKDTEAEATSIEMKDNDASPYVGDGHRGGSIGGSRSARASSELPVHFTRVGKDGGRHDFVEVDINEKGKN